MAMDLGMLTLHAYAEGKVGDDEVDSLSDSLSDDSSELSLGITGEQVLYASTSECNVLVYIWFYFFTNSN